MNVIEYIAHYQKSIGRISFIFTPENIVSINYSSLGLGTNQFWKKYSIHNKDESSQIEEKINSLDESGVKIITFENTDMSIIVDSKGKMKLYEWQPKAVIELDIADTFWNEFYSDVKNDNIGCYIGEYSQITKSGEIKENINLTEELFEILLSTVSNIKVYGEGMLFEGQVDGIDIYVAFGVKTPNACTHDNYDKINSLGNGMHSLYCYSCDNYVVEDCDVSSGYCLKCGYKCPHTYLSYTSYGNGTHNVSCSNCGITDIEDCEFVDGECSKCGYQCNHTYLSYTSNENETHSVICNDCGVSYTENCDFSTGYCMKCGANASN